MGWAWSMCSVTSRRGSPPFMKEIYRSPSSREQLSGSGSQLLTSSHRTWLLTLSESRVGISQARRDTSFVVPLSPAIFGSSLSDLSGHITHLCGDRRPLLPAVRRCHTNRRTRRRACRFIKAACLSCQKVSTETKTHFLQVTITGLFRGFVLINQGKGKKWWARRKATWGEAVLGP